MRMCNSQGFSHNLGTSGAFLRFNQSELLYAALKKAGVDVTFVPMKGAGYGFGGPDAITSVQDFLKRRVK